MRFCLIANSKLVPCFPLYKLRKMQWNSLKYACAETYQNWTRFDKVTAKIERCNLLRHTVYLNCTCRIQSTDNDELTDKVVQRVLQLMSEMLQSDRDLMKLKHKLLCPQHVQRHNAWTVGRCGGKILSITNGSVVTWNFRKFPTFVDSSGGPPGGNGWPLRLPYYLQTYKYIF